MREKPAFFVIAGETYHKRARKSPAFFFAAQRSTRTRNPKTLAVLAEAGGFCRAAQTELLECVAMHAMFVLRIGSEKGLHRRARVTRQRPTEKIVDALDGAERIALDRLEIHVEELRCRRAIAHGEKLIERARPTIRPISGNSLRICAVAERAPQHRRMTRHRRHHAQRIAMRVDDARVGITLEQACEREQVARRLQHPTIAGAFRLQVLQEAMVKIEAELLRRVFEPVLVRRNVVRRVELDAHEDLRSDRDALLRQSRPRSDGCA